jgi:hypothetical protein
MAKFSLLLLVEYTAEFRNSRNLCPYLPIICGQGNVPALETCYRNHFCTKANNFQKLPYYPLNSRSFFAYVNALSA